MATNSGGTSDPGSNGSDNESNGSHGNDSASQDGSSMNLLEFPPELLVQILGNMDSASLMTVRLASRTLNAVVSQLKFRLRLDSRRNSFFKIEGAKAQFVNLQNAETLSMAPHLNNGIRRNLKLKQLIEQLPTAWLKLASEVVLRVGDECHDGETKGILDELHARLLITRLPEQPAVKLHLVYFGDGDLPISFFTNKANANIADLQPQLELASLQLHYEFHHHSYAATKQIFDYFHGTAAEAEITLENIGRTADGDQLDFVYRRAADGSERFPNLRLLRFEREPTLTVDHPDWTIMARFPRLTHLQLFGGESGLTLPAWETTETMAAVRTLDISNVHLPGSFLAAMPGLREVSAGRLQDSQARTSNEVNQLDIALRNGLLPHLQRICFSCGTIQGQACLDHLKSLLGAAAGNKSPKLEHLGFLISLAERFPADDLRRVLGSFSDNSLEKTKFILAFAFFRHIPNVNSANLTNDILALAIETHRIGFKQLKLSVRFSDPQPDWQQIVAAFNCSQAMFSAEAQASPQVNATQIPGVFVRISFIDGPNLLIAKRAEAAISAMELPSILPQPHAAAEAVETASQN